MKDETAERIADLLGIKYAHAVRLIRKVNEGSADPFGLPFSDLAHACRELKEQEEAKRRKRNVLPKGAGRVNCTNCDATAAADGEGTPIVLKHDDGCPEKYPVKDHRYDAGHPRDDSKGCIYNLNYDWDPDGPELCGRPLSEHYRSEYEEDGR